LSESSSSHNHPWRGTSRPINTAEISAQRKFIFVILVAIYPFFNEIVEMPEKHLGKIHDPIFLLKKSGLYLWYWTSVQATMFAESAQNGE
jgi:hypothetical protein